MKKGTKIASITFAAASAVAGTGLLAGTAGATTTQHKPATPQILATYNLDGNKTVEFVPPGNPHEVVIDVNNSGPTLTSWQQTGSARKGGRSHIIAEFNMNGNAVIDFTPASNPNVFCVYTFGSGGYQQVSTINCSLKTNVSSSTAKLSAPKT